jgi:hypothetical protein
MKQEIVLPKFKVPGQRNWLVTGLWIAGGVVLLQAVIVGAILMRHQDKEGGNGAKAEGAPAPADEQAAMAQKAAQPRADAKAATKATTKATTTTARTDKPVLANQHPAAVKPASALAGKPHARGGHGLRKKAARSKSNKLMARSAGNRPGARPAKTTARATTRSGKAAGGKGGDAIDEILKGFK